MSCQTPSAVQKLDLEQHAVLQVEQLASLYSASGGQGGMRPDGRKLNGVSRTKLKNRRTLPSPCTASEALEQGQ